MMNRIKKTGWLAPAALLVFVFLSAEIVDRVVAVVGSDVITERELNEAYEKDALGLMGSGVAPGGTAGRLTREQYLDRMIDHKVIAQEVKRQGIKVDALEVEKTIDRKREGMGMTEEDFARALRKQGISMEIYREQVKEQLTTFRLISVEVRGEIEVKDDEIVAFYKQNSDQFTANDQYHVFHIFLVFPKDAPEATRQATAAKLEKIRAQIVAGMEFEEAAKKYSDSPTGPSGGDLGWFKLEALLPAFREQVKKLSLGQMSPVFIHENGAHLIMVKAIKTGDKVPFDQVKDDIRDLIYQQKAIERYDLWLQRLKGRTYIENRLTAK
jgi:peptidyl-prolyl cis-trans isomerase SurA